MVIGFYKKNTIGSEMRIKNSAGEECVMKFLGAGKGFMGFAQVMTQHLNKRL